eukprot:1156698-Pelagomonas_calceolata.AAC.4
MQAAPGPSTEESTSCSGQQQQPASPSRAAAQEPSAAALGHAASASPDHSRSRASSVDFGHGAGAAASSAAPEQGSFGEGQEQSSYSAGALPVPAVASDAGAVHGLAGSSSSKGFEQGEVISVPAAEWRGLQQRLQELEGRNRELEEAMAVLRAGSEHTVAELQSHIAHLEGTHGKQGDAWMQPSSPKRQAAVSLQMPSGVNRVGAAKLPQAAGCSVPTRRMGCAWCCCVFRCVATASGVFDCFGHCQRWTIAPVSLDTLFPGSLSQV